MRGFAAGSTTTTSAATWPKPKPAPPTSTGTTCSAYLGSSGDRATAIEPLVLGRRDLGRACANSLPSCTSSAASRARRKPRRSTTPSPCRRISRARVFTWTIVRASPDRSPRSSCCRAVRPARRPWLRRRTPPGGLADVGQETLDQRDLRGTPAARDGRVGECQQHLDSGRSVHPDVQAVVGVIPAQEFRCTSRKSAVRAPYKRSVTCTMSRSGIGRRRGIRSSRAKQFSA